MIETGKCERCHVFCNLEGHHDFRRTNNEKSIRKVCHSCHMWIHQHPKLAREEGFYKSFDGVFRKKESSHNKWKLKKK